MSEQIITNDKSFIYKYHKKPTQEEDTPDSIICNYCGKKKIRFGRFFKCACSGKQISLSTGKPIKRQLKKY